VKIWKIRAIVNCIIANNLVLKFISTTQKQIDRALGYCDYPNEYFWKLDDFGSITKRLPLNHQNPKNIHLKKIRLVNNKL
jgi:hypothetical protein